MQYILNLIYIGLLLPSLIIQWNLLQKFSQSLLKSLLVYSFAGGIFLGLIRVLFFFADNQILPIDEMSLMIGWHVMFYITLTIFLIASRTLLKMSNLKDVHKIANPYPVSFSLGILMLLIFPLTIFINQWAMNVFEHSVLSHIGLLHFIAFAFAAFLAYDLGLIKKKFSSGIGVISTPLQLVLVILSYIHFQELLIESWNVITIPGEIGETIEGILWIPVFALFLYAFYALKKVVQTKEHASY